MYHVSLFISKRVYQCFNIIVLLLDQVWLFIGRMKREMGVR